MHNRANPQFVLLRELFLGSKHIAMNGKSLDLRDHLLSGQVVGLKPYK
jgi:hypothetical protein